MIRPSIVHPGVQAFAARTPTLPPATHTNSYALGARDVLLVEPATPYEDERREWLDWARGIASSGRRLVALFVTHHHRDHIGGAAFLSSELGLPLWGHPATAERLGGLVFTRRLEGGEAIVLGGPTPQRWEVLHTAGHAPGHLCLFERELGQLVVGDMVASEGTILIDPQDGDMAEYLVQLARLEALQAALALPAHGAPISAPSNLFAMYIRHRNLREAKILAALQDFGKQGASSQQLVPVAYADTPAQAWGLAALSVAAHLIKLQAEGHVHSEAERYVAELA